MHNMFHHHSPSEFTEDLHVPLTDGSKNWIRVIYPVKKAALNKAGGMLIYILLCSCSSIYLSDLPVFIWFHGGGYCLGNFTFEDDFLLPLAQVCTELLHFSSHWIATWRNCNFSWLSFVAGEQISCSYLWCLFDLHMDLRECASFGWKQKENLHWWWKFRYSLPLYSAHL